MKIRKDATGKLTVQFDASWERVYLIALQDTGKNWASFYLTGQAEAIGRVHTKTHQVQLREEQDMVNELDVVLKDR